ncbi:MAG: hypothetical protein R3C26_22100 [Calditrichia bacterium]
MLDLVGFADVRLPGHHFRTGFLDVRFPGFEMSRCGCKSRFSHRSLCIEWQMALPSPVPPPVTMAT